MPYVAPHRPAPIGETKHQEAVRLAERALLGQRSKRAWAAAVGLNHTMVSRMLRGERDFDSMSTRNAINLAAVLGLNLMQLKVKVERVQTAWRALLKHEASKASRARTAQRQKKG